MSKKLNIGLFGFGCVGQGFYELLDQGDSNLVVKKVVVKNANRSRVIDQATFSTCHDDIINDPEIDIVVELIDEPDVALDILKKSLARKKPVVTANKKMIAENLEEIYWLQLKYQTPVLYEGAVCGSIPIIRNLETHYVHDEIRSIEGIFNGSTNYILTKMIEEKKSFLESLKEAQELGFAESDPTLDIKGFDPKYKLAIAAAHAFGIFVGPEQIINVGIEKINEHNIRYARQNNLSIKLIAQAKRIGNKIFALVAPQFVPAESNLSQVRYEFNAINIEAASSGLHTLIGKGAGSLPTGIVVLSDVMSIVSGLKYQYSKIKKSKYWRFEKNALLNVHVSFAENGAISYSDFEEFNGGFQSPHYQVMNGWITTQKLRNWNERDDLSVILNWEQSIKTTEGKKVAELSFV